MEDRFRLLVVLLLCVLPAVVPPVAFAQTPASFRGTVRDQTGATVPGATVAIKNERTGEVREVVSGADGGYVAPNLRPSVYTITSTVGDFKPVEFKGLELAAGQVFYLDLEMKAAGVTETVTVTAASPTIDL